MPDHSLEKPAHCRRKEARPTEIIAAALHFFDEKGYAATRLDDVALRAGVSKGTIYLYFDSKEALFNAVVREGLVKALSGWEVRLANDAGNSSNLLGELVLDFSRTIGSDQAGAVLKLVLSEAGNFPDIAHAYHDCVIAPGIDLIRKVVMRGMARQEFRSVNPEIAAHIILAPLLMRVIGERSFSCGRPGISTEQFLAKYLDLVLGGFRPTRY
ncbi:MAG: TetR/AcrR family transcriptional regulator [Georgfuchsia sp.]